MADWKETDIIEVDQPDLSLAERLYVPQILDGLRVTLGHLLRKRERDAYVVQYPEQVAPVSVDRHRGVHRLNRDEDGRVACVACFLCATACPAHCIHIEAAEAPWPDREKYPVRFDIDELRCIFCGMCEEACPVDAIELTPLHDWVGTSRDEMVLDREQLLAVYDMTKDMKPRKNPAITGRSFGEKSG